jgi:hypothetical protein
MLNAVELFPEWELHLVISSLQRWRSGHNLARLESLLVT